ncbi:fimbrial protein [Citrobacter amalonaticus]|uniref:Fimbrial protein n=1 Tax=Citrobacter amalonaticus TaxID=35703 RepID=A0A2S4RWP2_CITAM|nr:EAL domain-containing protein [Citrobacter amalonaticus]POT57223.1 fimbrial protein [Citrobacter amalonaticus]POT75248.1 fimbrial protein [Citrobacter amalonaticus]POU64772.1 fimbrial protein [Citrobacter amalonaticus]POV04847.1 fimbrial protein [Citrobacter amalonaticus]
MDYILSPCSFAAKGLAGMMAHGDRHLTLLQPQAQAILSLPSPAAVGRIVVFLPDDPIWLLTTLRQAAFLLEQASTPLPMLILSRCPIRWLQHTLLYLVAERGQLSQVRAAASDLPGRCIAALLREEALLDYPLLAQLSEQETLIYGDTTNGLSKQELNAILDLLLGFNIAERAQYRGVSQKTLYNQRTSGLKKMVEHHPLLAANFPGNPVTRQNRMNSGGLSAFEREFVHAIHCRQVFPVFQPIIDDKHRLQGVEILSRWRRNGNVLPPGAFLPQISSEYAWMVLTAFVLQEAIQKINQYPGDIYFAINIPSALASHENLVRMMEKARQKLHQPRRTDRLVLEFAETIDVRRQGKTSEVVAELQQHGFRVTLDDCFSQGSVMFPVRQIRFSEYKLDMGIINDMQRDPHALALIKSLIYYCQLTGSRCIAEGVDSVEKLTMLKALGMDRFQGHLISPPVGSHELGTLIRYHQSQQVVSKDKADA